MKLARPFFVCLLVGSYATAEAQARRLGLNADFAIGGGERTQYTGRAWFRGHTTAQVRMSFAASYEVFDAVRVVAQVDRTADGLAGDYTDMCYSAPDGSCRQRFPRVGGNSAGLGLRVTPLKAIDIGFAAGRGTMSGPSRYVEGDVAVRLFRYVGVVGNYRRIVIDHSSGDRLTWRPVTVGLRIQR